jgi:hypothetical protein
VNVGDIVEDIDAVCVEVLLGYREEDVTPGVALMVGSGG